MNKEIIKELKEIEKKLGIEAYNSLLDIFARMQNRIEDLIKARDNWRDKYKSLKEIKKI